MEAGVAAHVMATSASMGWSSASGAELRLLSLARIESRRLLRGVPGCESLPDDGMCVVRRGSLWLVKVLARLAKFLLTGALAGVAWRACGGGAARHGTQRPRTH